MCQQKKKPAENALCVQLRHESSGSERTGKVNWGQTKSTWQYSTVRVTKLRDWI